MKGYYKILLSLLMILVIGILNLGFLFSEGTYTCEGLENYKDSLNKDIDSYNTSLVVLYDEVMPVLEEILACFKSSDGSCIYPLLEEKMVKIKEIDEKLDDINRTYNDLNADILAYNNFKQNCLNNQNLDVSNVCEYLADSACEYPLEVLQPQENCIGYNLRMQGDPYAYMCSGQNDNLARACKLETNVVGGTFDACNSPLGHIVFEECCSLFLEGYRNKYPYTTSDGTKRYGCESNIELDNFVNLFWLNVDNTELNIEIINCDVPNFSGEMYQKCCVNN